MDTLNKIKPQRGFALFMTLVTLIIITISGIAMMRLMEAGTSAAGNIAFRQASVRVASVAGEAALSWLSDSAQSKAVLAATSGSYYANSSAAFNPTTYDWDNNSTAIPAQVAGYSVNYIIRRLAMNDGLCEDPVANAGCTYSSSASSIGTSEGDTQAAGSTNNPGLSNIGGLVYYQVTARVSGPRHNVSYVQTLMY